MSLTIKKILAYVVSIAIIYFSGNIFMVPFIVLAILFGRKYFSRLNQGIKELYLSALVGDIATFFIVVYAGLILSKSYIGTSSTFFLILRQLASSSGLYLIVHTLLYKYVFQIEIFNPENLQIQKQPPKLLTLTSNILPFIGLALFTIMAVIFQISQDLWVQILNWIQFLYLLLIIPSIGFFKYKNTPPRYYFLKKLTFGYITLLIINFSGVIGHVIFLLLSKVFLKNS